MLVYKERGAPKCVRCRCSMYNHISFYLQPELASRACVCITLFHKYMTEFSSSLRVPHTLGAPF
ncbi:hypothetical protein Hanom_Chr00s015538g01754931 [Helianthus anomalus]